MHQAIHPWFHRIKIIHGNYGYHVHNQLKKRKNQKRRIPLMGTGSFLRRHKIKYRDKEYDNTAYDLGFTHYHINYPLSAFSITPIMFMAFTGFKI